MSGELRYFDGPAALVIVTSGVVLLAAVVNCVRCWFAEANEPDGDDLNTQQLLECIGRPSMPARPRR